jgi:DNA-binding CsgD family transcriptional regulator
MSIDERELLRLSVMAHEAATDATLWPNFLQRYAHAMNVNTAIIQRHDFAQHHSHLVATVGLTQPSTDSYNRHYSRLNVWREHSRHLYVLGRAIRDEAMYPRPLLEKTEFYNDYLLQNSISRSLAGVIARGAEEAFVLTALRGEREDHFSTRDVRAVECLLPHVTRAFLTRERLDTLLAGEAALDSLSHGVVLLARDGRIVFCNRVADEVFRSEDGLLRRNERVDVSNSNSQAALHRAVEYAMFAGESFTAPKDVGVPRSSGRRPYRLAATPLRRVLPAFAGMRTPIVLLLITDPERHRMMGPDLLSQVYGLTPRESAVALTLAGGLTLEQAAEHLKMRYETARTHLRRVLGKTETTCQAELLQLLERLSH